MHTSGLEVFEKRKVEKSRTYSYENKPEKLPDEFVNKILLNDKAWQYFSLLPASYKRTVYFWIMDAKQEATRINRLEKLIKASEAGNKIF